MDLTKRQVELALIALEHYVDCDIEDEMRNEMLSLVDILVKNQGEVDSDSNEYREVNQVSFENGACDYYDYLEEANEYARKNKTEIIDVEIVDASLVDYLKPFRQKPAKMALEQSDE